MSAEDRRIELLDESKYEEVNKTIEAEKPLMFMPHFVDDYTYCPGKYKKGNYAVAISGILIDGRKINAILTGIPLFFDVRVNTEKTGDEFIERLEEHHDPDNYRKCMKPESTEFIMAKPLMEYTSEPQVYLRLYYRKLAWRNNAIKFAIDSGYDTATDDKSKYYKIVSRNYDKSFAKWNLITDYTITNVNGFLDECIIVNYKNFNTYTGTITKELMFCNLLVMSFDIETYSSYKNVIPLPERDDDEIMVIGINFNWFWSEKPLKRVAISRYSLMKTGWAKATNTEFIVCRKESDLLETFFDVWKQFAPDYVIQFNGFKYDIPWIVERSYRYGMYQYIADSISRLAAYQPIKNENDFTSKHYKYASYKVSADQNIEYNLLCGYGFIGLDMMVLYKKIHPNLASHSLKSFLEKENKKSKDDMPYDTMHNAFTKLLTYKKPYRWHSATDKSETDKTVLQTQVDKTVLQTQTDKTKKERKEREEKKEELITQLSSQTNEEFNKLLEDITEYCIIDALRCQDLFLARNLVIDKQNLANVVYMSVRESFYNADSMKVVNMTLGRAFRKSYLGSSISRGEAFTGKYEGAYVRHPKQGVYAPKTTPHELLIKAYELSTDKKFLQNVEMSTEVMNEILSTTLDQLRLAQAIGNKYVDEFGGKIPEHKIDEYIEKKFGISAKSTILDSEQLEKSRKLLPMWLRKYLSADIPRPDFGLDFSSLYPSIIINYNLSPEKITKNKPVARCMAKTFGEDKLQRIEFQHNGEQVRAWVLRHNNIDDIKHADYNMGLFPEILLELFALRKSLKAELKVLKTAKENFLLLSADEQKTRSEEFADLCAKYNYADARQNTVKLVMNTFYGTVGSKINALCLLELAGAVTMFGREHIKHAGNFVESVLRHYILYGDTDSLYIMLNDLVYRELDKYYFTDEAMGINLFINGKLIFDQENAADHIEKYDTAYIALKKKYTEDCIALTMKIAPDVEKKVNNAVAEKAGTPYLVMAYEEVLYYAAFFAMKKYTGLMHIGKVKVDIDSDEQILKKGIDLVKKNVSKMAKVIGWSVLRKILSYKNKYTMLELIHIEIDAAFKKQWSIEEFVSRSTYKKDKKNTKLITFKNYLEKEYNYMVEDGEILNCVVVKRSGKFDFDGTVKKNSVGDCMELVSFAKERNMEIDLMYYMTSSVCGQLARLIAFYQKFYVQPVNDTHSAIKDAGAKSFALAKKYVEKIIGTYAPPEINTGVSLKRNYRTVTKAIKTELSKKQIAPLIGTNKFKLGSTEVFRQELLENVHNTAKKKCEDYAKNFYKIAMYKVYGTKRTEKEMALYKMYKKLKYGSNKFMKKMAAYKSKQGLLIAKLDKNILDFKQIFDKFREKITKTVFVSTEIPEEQTSNDISEFVRSDFDANPKYITFHRWYVDALTVEMDIQQLLAISELLKSVRDTKEGVPTIKQDKFTSQQVSEMDIDLGSF